MAEKSEGSHRRLGRPQASRYLEEQWGVRYKPRTLAKLAVEGGGPPFFYIGRFPIYEVEDLDAWAVGRMRGPFSSTTEAMATPSSEQTCRDAPNEKQEGHVRQRGVISMVA